MAEALDGRFGGLRTASTASALGSGLATIAAPLFAAAHTRSPLIVSATSGAAWLPWLAGSTILFVAAGGNCVGAMPGGVIAADFGITALTGPGSWPRPSCPPPHGGSSTGATVAQAYAEPVLSGNP